MDIYVGRPSGSRSAQAPVISGYIYIGIGIDIDMYIYVWRHDLHGYI